MKEKERLARHTGLEARGCEWSTAERRQELVRILGERRHESIQRLATELGVSERTVRRDVDAISRTVPVYTKTGRYEGGVYLVAGYDTQKRYLAPDEEALLRRVLALVAGEGALLPEELHLFRQILQKYSTPHGA